MGTVGSWLVSDATSVMAVVCGKPPDHRQLFPSFLPSLLFSTRLKQERVREGGERGGFQIRYANQIAEPKTGGESESNADLKPGNECGELECKARHTHRYRRPVDSACNSGGYLKF